MAKFSLDSGNVYNLGFGMPGFVSPARGSGVRFGRVVPPRSRLVRLRGLGDALDDLDAQILNNPGAFDGSGASATYDWGTWWNSGSSNTSGSGASQVTVVPASGGGTTSVATSILKDIATAYQIGAQAVAQQKITNLNVQRAAQGLPLIDPRYFSPSAAVNFGLTPQMSQMLVIGGVALLAFMALKRR